MKISFDAKGDFENARAWLKRVAQGNPSVVANQIASEGTRSLASHTPRDTGETAAGWTSKVTTNGHVTEIDWINTAHPEASANVAKIIELGHGTGTGGYVPPRPYIKQAMDPIFNDVGDKVAKELIK
jgi:hypothetical protein